MKKLTGVGAWFGAVRVLLVGCLGLAALVGVPSPALSASPQRVIVISGVDANTLDPHFQQTVNPEWNLKNHFFNGLVWRNDNMETVPMLAESWRVLDDLTWEFKLRKGVTFHNGEPFNAASVQFAFGRSGDPRIKGSDRTAEQIFLDRVEIVDDYTVRLITKKPAPSMLSRLFEFAMLPPKYYSENPPSAVARRPVGTGPYKFAEWVKDDHITLEANPDYWAGPPKIKTIIWKPIPEAGTRIAELQAGNADIISAVPPDQAKGLDTAKTRLAPIQGLRKMHIGIHNVAGTPLMDKRVRQAINYSVDVETIGKTIMGGYCKRMQSMIHAPNINPALKPYTYDPEKAKKLLAEAGCVPGSFSATLDFGVGRYMKDKEVVQAVADYLTKMGIRTTVRQLDWGTFFGQLIPARKTSEFYFLGLGTYIDPVIEAQMFVKDHVNNGTEWYNEEYESLHKEASTTIDEAKRKKIIYRMQEIAWDECPWLFLYNQFDLYGVSKRLDWKARPDERIYLANALLVE